MDLENRCKALIAELGIAAASQVQDVRPLTGGVASDIALVDLGDRKLCVKFALPKLKVAAEWRAPVHRNAAEYAWLQAAAAIQPESAPALYGRSEAEHGFAMEYLAGADVYLWKAHLLEERPGAGEAAKVGALIGRIHAASTEESFDRSAFENHDDFRELRIEPYLGETRRVHPALAEAIQPQEDKLYASRAVLVHGDASPKNILFRASRPVMLDAECATLGDAAFDPAFCLNHLVLKALHLPGSRARLLAEIGAFWRAYAAHVTWEDPAALERRVSALLPVLMLARVDGKSPVEYLSDDERAAVRNIAIPLITAPPGTLARFAEQMAQFLSKGTA